MSQTIVKLIKKYNQVISYLIFGVLTTLVNYVIYLACTRIIHLDYAVSTVLAWIVAVLFAYITNKRFVFESKTIKGKAALKEMLSFFYFRAISLIFDIGAMWLMVSILGMNDALAKILSNVIVVIINYIFSKFFIFKKS